VQRARQQLPGHDIRVGDIRSLPFDDGSFDVVVLNYVLEHTCEPNRVVSEALRVLRPGGLLGMIVPVMDMVWMTPSSLRHRSRDLKFLAGYTAERWLHFLRLRYDARYFAFPLVEQPVVFENSQGQFMPDDDQVYIGSTLEVEKFLRASGCEIAYSAGRDIKTFVRNGRRRWVDLARTAVFGLVRASLKIHEWEQFTTTRTWVARKL
jgi:SAM-dependent methyltransferase